MIMTQAAKGGAAGQSPFASMPGGSAPNAGAGGAAGKGGSTQATPNSTAYAPPNGQGAKGGAQGASPQGQSQQQQIASLFAPSGSQASSQSASPQSSPSSPSAPATPSSPGGYVPGSTITDAQLAAANANLPPGVQPRTKADIEQQQYNPDLANVQAYAGSISSGQALPQKVQDSINRLKTAGIPLPGSTG